MIIHIKSLDATQSIEAQTQRWNEDCSIYSACCTVSLYRNMQVLDGALRCGLKQVASLTLLRLLG